MTSLLQLSVDLRARQGGGWLAEWHWLAEVDGRPTEGKNDRVLPESMTAAHALRAIEGAVALALGGVADDGLAEALGASCSTPVATVAEGAELHRRRHRPSETDADAYTTQPVVDIIARTIARRRTGGAVYMDGSDNPTAGEQALAEEIARDLGTDLDAPLDLLFSHARAEGAREERDRIVALLDDTRPRDTPYPSIIDDTDFGFRNGEQYRHDHIRELIACDSHRETDQ